MNKYFLGLVGATFSIFVSANPIYLKCIVNDEDDKKVKNFSVSVDESINNVTHTEPSGYSFNAEGFFTADKISYKQTLPGTVTISRIVNISRINLSASYIIKIGSGQTSAFGSCEIVKVKERKF